MTGAGGSVKLEYPADLAQVLADLKIAADLLLYLLRKNPSQWFSTVFDNLPRSGDIVLTYGNR